MSDRQLDKAEAQKRMRKYSKEEIAESFYRAMVLGQDFTIQEKERGSNDFAEDMYRIAEGAYNIRGTVNGKRRKDDREDIKNRYKGGRYANEYNSYRRRLEGSVTREDILWVLKKYPQGIPDDGRWLIQKFPGGIPADVPNYKPFEEILWERQNIETEEMPGREPGTRRTVMPQKMPQVVPLKELKGMGNHLSMLKNVALAVLAVFVLLFLMRACSNLGGPGGFFGKYQFQVFSYKDAMYAGNQKSGKPQGLCASIPQDSGGTFYALGEFEGGMINGYGIVCTSDIALQSWHFNEVEESEFDKAKLQIKMGEMKSGVLNGYGLIWTSPEEITLGYFKEGKLKKYGCRVLLDERGSIVSVEILKKDKVKKRLESGTYKGITFKPEENSITIDEAVYTVYGQTVTLRTEETRMAVNGREWEMDLYGKKSEEGIFMKYTLGKKVTCEVRKNVLTGVRVNTSEFPIQYGIQ